MTGHLLTWLLAAVVFLAAGSVDAGALKALPKGSVQPKKDMAVLYFDSSSRLDVSIMAEFISECEKVQNVTCICAESSEKGDAEVIEEFRGSKNESCLYRGSAEGVMPFIEFYKGGALAGTVAKGGNFAGLMPVYLKYIAGVTGRDSFEAGLAEAENAQEYKKIIPRMRFVLMLARKGEIDSAIRELDKMSAYNLDDKSRLLLGETYLRLKAPERAAEVFAGCADTNCIFYKGVAEYLAGSYDKSLETFKGLRRSYGDLNKLNYYIKKIYEAKGDKKHADEIRLPENYNIDSD